MKRRIALLLVLVLALSFVLASCGKKECATHTDADIDEVCDVCGAAVPFEPEYLGFEGYYNTTYENEDAAEALKAPVKLPGIDFYDLPSVVGNLALYENINAEAGKTKLVVVNLDTNAIVYSLVQEKLVKAQETDVLDTAIKTATLKSVCGGQTIIVENKVDTFDKYNTVYTQTLYTALGAQIATASATEAREVGVSRPENAPFRSFTSLSTLSSKYFSFADKVYSLKDDVAAFKCDLGIAELPSYDLETDTYNYIFDYDAIYVYDATDKLVAKYEKPLDAYYWIPNVLSNGNLLVQYIVELPYFATEYDVMTDLDYGDVEVRDGKFDLKTVIFNVADSTATEINFNYLINDVTNTLVYEDFNKVFVEGKVENFVELAPIVDKRIDYSNTVYASLRTSDAKVLGYLGQEVANQDGIAELIDNNRFIVSDKTGKTYLLNEKGAVLADVSALDFYNDIVTVDTVMLIIVGDKAYNTSLELVMDMNNMGYYYDYMTGLYAKTNDKIVSEGVTEPSTTYYTMYNAQFVEVKLPENYTNLSVEERYITYIDNVAATETEAAKTYRVYLNMQGAEILRVLTSPEVSTAEGVTTTVTRSVSMVYSNSDNGYIFCTTTTTTVGTEAPVVVYEYSIAK